MVRSGAKLATACCAALMALALSACEPSGPGAGQKVGDSADIGAGAPAAPISAEELGAPASSEQRAAYEGEFEAVGSGEPFWRLDLLEDWVSFTRPGLPDVSGLPSPRDYRTEGVRIAAGPLTIVIRQEECAHEGAGTFPYKAVVYFEGVPYDGCARRGGGQTGGSSAWSAMIPQLIPAIDACLARIDRKPARVTIAYVLEGGEASVRLRDADGGRWECNAPASGGAVNYWDTIGDRNILPGENDPEFIRAPTAPPTAGPCRVNTQASGAGGAVLGWLTRKTC